MRDKSNIITSNIFIVLIALCLTAASLTWHWFRSKFLLDKWAKEHGFELLKMNYPLLGAGPFWWASKRQEVYRIRVRDRSGREHSGWANAADFGVVSSSIKSRSNWINQQCCPGGWIRGFRLLDVGEFVWVRQGKR